jgi:hypothetical protein
MREGEGGGEKIKFPLPFTLLDMVFLFSPVIYETFYLTG